LFRGFWTPLAAWAITMKTRCLLKDTSRRKSVVLMLGLLGAATIASAVPDQNQTATKPGATTPPQSETLATPNPQKKKFPQGGVWHHFGEKDNASVAGQSQPGIGHSIGLGTSKVSPNTTAHHQSLGPHSRTDLERQMWALVNQDRSKPETFAETYGRSQPLKWNERLAAVARAHSRNMLEQQFFAHVDLNGESFVTRINEAGIPWQATGENIAIYDTVSGAEAAFMNEPRFQHNHRANILNNSYTDVGIGIVQGPDGSLYITQDFVETPPPRGRITSAP
jgi:uncharacterized protein YkwD